MPEEAYDLFSGQYVQVKPEKEAFDELLTCMLEQLSRIYMDKVEVGYFYQVSGKPIRLIGYDDFIDVVWKPPATKPIAWAEIMNYSSFTGYSPKSIYTQPVREKFRGRARQANQPGDQPWKGKRK
jgi:hypothetical protein